MVSVTENIACLIKKPKTPIIKPPLYYSMYYLESAKRARDSKKDCHRTMGSVDMKIDPKNFLKKNSRKVIRPIVEKTVPQLCVKNTTVRPKYDRGVGDAGKSIKANADKPKAKINYVRMNVIDVIRKAPKIPEHRSQDTRNGHVIVLDKAGLEPTHVMNKNFGKVPAYIKRKYKAEEAAKLVEEERLRSVKKPYRILSVEEREELLKTLKTKWSAMHDEFFRFPLITDTPTNVKRKAQMERDILHLECNIAYVDRFKTMEINVDPEEVLNRYAKQSRKIMLL